MFDKELMRQMILDHYENPRNKVEVEPKYSYVGHNDSPSCIDNIDAFLNIKNDKIIDIKFKGLACAICTSSTDIMSSLLIGKSIHDAQAIIEEYYKMIKSEKFSEERIESLIIFKNVNQQANRIKCALTGIQAIEKGLKKYEK